MFADSRTRNGARSIGRGVERHATLRTRCCEEAGQLGGLIDVPDLREVPRHELDVAQAAAERRHALGRAALALARADSSNAAT